MLSLPLIEDELANFDKTILKRGYSYYQNDMVLEVSINEEEGEIEAEVSGSSRANYEVEFDFVEDDEPFLVGHCDCPYGDYCKHQAAVLYELYSWVSDEEAPPPIHMKRQGRPSKDRPRLGRPPKSVSATYELQGKGAATYRKLLIGDEGSYTFLQRYKPNSFRALQWNENFEGGFISNTELEIKTTSNYNYYRFEEQKIVLKIEDGELSVKCLSCNSKSKKLCQHQMAILSRTNRILDQNGFYNGKFDYQKFVEQNAEKFGVNPDAFDKYFSIELKTDGFGVAPLHDNIVNTNWLKKAEAYADVHKTSRKDLIKEQTRVLEEGRDRKFAFMWSSDPYDGDTGIEIFFVKGYGFKTKEGIHTTKREIDEVPTGFPEPLQTMAQQLFFLAQKEEDSSRFASVKTFIENNIESLNDFYQYAYHGHPQHTNIRASDLHLVTFHPTPLQCKFVVTKKDGLVQLTRQVTLDEQAFDYSKVVIHNELFSVSSSIAYLHPNHQFNNFMDLFMDQETLILPYTNKKDYSKLINGFKQYFEVEVDPDLVMKEEILETPKFQILLREVGMFVLFEPRLKYGEYSFNAFDEDDYQINKKVFKPDEADRLFLIDFLKNVHPEFDNHLQVQEYVYLDVKAMINNYWFVHFNAACESAGIEVLGQKDLTKFKYSKFKASTFSHVKSGIDWFGVNMGVSFGKEKVKMADWIRALRNKESFVTLKDGSLGILPEEWLEQAKKILAVADLEKGELKISKYRFNIIEDLFDEIDDKKVIKELQEKKKRLAEYDANKKYKLPKIITADLRDYQKHGFTWLKFLDDSGFGGILADDMGLGKTLQVISLLADQIKEPTSLVIVPRSLLFNWGAELDKFCSKLKYVIHHGQGREKTIEVLTKNNIIITTYGTAASDIELLKTFKFNYIILDESQAIKNPNSKRYKAMRLLQSKNKLAMTGTPIENNTFDLYAQLSFTSPGLLGTKTHFKNNFAIPIDNNGDTDAANLLRKLIHPFLLRRTKDQVAKDLPDKTESIIYCEMGATQRKLYTNLKNKIKEDIEDAVEEKGLAKSKFQMLDGLLRLRQMCNSPLLVNDSFSGSNAESVKINILLNHITEQLDNHNALIFSQFVSLLSIVRKELDKLGIKYAYLDGSTTKRQAEVDKFMNTSDIKIFLISLKAGNTGMNLTKADYVYILDPWWNPAAEAQAIDRTHRIGQDKQIFAYKLICKDSIEEKILKLQERKKNLAKDIIRTDENVLKSLNKKDLMALFD